MKCLKADLTANVVTSYDQTKTTITGRITQKTIDGKQVLGPILNKFIDVATDSASAAVPVLNYVSDSGRVFTLGAEASGVAVLSLHTYDFNTGNSVYVGCIRVSLPDNAATTHVLRALKVIDTGTTGWKIYIATSGSVLINGGLFCVNNIDFSDFSPIAIPTIPYANGNNQKAVYFLQDPANIGVGQLNIAAAGAVLDPANNKIYVHNGVSATHQFYVYNTDSILNCPLSSVSVDAGTDVVSHAGHTFLNNDPVYITNLSGGTGLANNTIYYIRNIVAGVSYQLSLTSGGTVVNVTANGTFDICRAFGTTGGAFSHKTGNLPALAGTLLASDCEDRAVPQHTTNAGFPCVFFATSTNLYLGRISELTNGTTSWPSLVTSNLLGASNQVVTPTAVLASWSDVLDRALYTTNANLFVTKRVVNNEIDAIFGGTGNEYLEARPSNIVVDFKPVTVSALDFSMGVLFTVGSAVGQRGVFTLDCFSDHVYNNSYIITKVVDTPAAQLTTVDTWEELYDYTGVPVFQYRTSGFGSPTGGWADITAKTDLSSLASADQVQFKIGFDIMHEGGGIPAQISEFLIGINSNSEISDNWEFSNDDSDNGNPSRAAFRLKKVYASSVPTLHFRAYDLSDSLIVNHTTVANASNFQYSTDGGVNWNNVGTIPNTVGTLVRYTFTVAPGVDIRPSLRES